MPSRDLVVVALIGLVSAWFVSSSSAEKGIPDTDSPGGEPEKDDV